MCFENYTLCGQLRNAPYCELKWSIRRDSERSFQCRNTYVSKIVWFRYDYGMMVWMWYDCMTSVWWCDSFVCECCECIQIEEIAKKCNKTKNRLKEPQKISLTFFCNISPNTATRGFPEDLWRPEKNVFGRDLVCLRVSMCIYWRPRRAKVLFFILSYQRNI